MTVDVHRAVTGNIGRGRGIRGREGYHNLHVIRDSSGLFESELPGVGCQIIVQMYIGARSPRTGSSSHKFGS